jgi:hypothetical protein
MVYVVSGYHNSNYNGIFCYVFDSEAKMLDKVNELMAEDMDMSIEEFSKLQKNNQENFNDMFPDGSERTYEECMNEQSYYSNDGYEITWGNRNVM